MYFIAIQPKVCGGVYAFLVILWWAQGVATIQCFSSVCGLSKKLISDNSIHKALLMVQATTLPA